MPDVLIQNNKIRSLYDLDQVMGKRAGQKNRVEITPLTDDILCGDTLLAKTERAQLYFASFDNLSVNGVISKNDMAFGVYLEADGSSTMMDETISVGKLGYFPPGFEHRATYNSNIQFGLLLLDPEYFGELCEARNINFNSKSLRHGFLSTTPKTLSDEISRQFRLLQQTFATNPIALQDELGLQLVVEDLIETYSMAFEPYQDRSHRKFLEIEKHTKIIDLVESMLHADPENLLQIEEISNTLGLSRRTVYRAFVKQFNVSPNYYIRSWRLARAYMDLRQHKVDKVIDASQKWGFSSPSRFASYYRDQFKESPSTTLRSITPPSNQTNTAH